MPKTSDDVASLSWFQNGFHSFLPETNTHEKTKVGTCLPRNGRKDTQVFTILCRQD